LHGIVAVILAISIGATLVIMALETVLHSGAISDTEANVLSTVIGAAVGSIATYLGVSKSNETKDTN
jgi:cytochrome bd-type quinol oxidase subunit 2